MSYQKMRTKNLIRNILIGISALLLIGCEDTYYEKEPFISFDWDVRLPIDENGYYHLEMDRNNFQTLHRISGNVSEENIMVNWESDLYWVLGDTLGYIVKSGYTDDLVYVAYDTVYVTGFEGELVRTTNWTSYSNSKGEINNMIAPVKTMIGDTLNVGAYYDYELIEVFNIVLD
jgi:hypothetical protein